MKNGKPVVLIVEDNTIIRMSAVDLVFRRAMKHWKRATPTRQSAFSKDGNIDLVFTDVQMPGTMDGIKLSHYIRDRWPPLKLIIASGAAIVEESMLPVGSRFFSKPYDDLTITEAMDALLASDDPKARSV